MVRLAGKRPIGFFPLMVVAVGLAALFYAVVWFQRDDPATRPYLNILGAGFVFNYRIADVYYGFTAVVKRPLSVGSVIEASFEDPGGGETHRARLRVGTATTRYSLRSPPVRGVKAGRPYLVMIRILDHEESTVLWTHSFTVTSQIDDLLVPDKPLTIGPGYHRAE